MNQDHIATPEEEEAFNAVEQQSNLGKQILRDMKPKPWVGLTDEEMLAAIRPMYRSDGIAQNALDLSKDEYKAIEAALKEKNT
jgi:hypothetical protein